MIHSINFNWWSLYLWQWNVQSGLTRLANDDGESEAQKAYKFLLLSGDNWGSFIFWFIPFLQFSTPLIFKLVKKVARNTQRVHKTFQNINVNEAQTSEKKIIWKQHRPSSSTWVSSEQSVKRFWYLSLEIPHSLTRLHHL
jgi:hypothetical protein